MSPAETCWDHDIMMTSLEVYRSQASANNCRTMHILSLYVIILCHCHPLSNYNRNISKHIGMIPWTSLRHASAEALAASSFTGASWNVGCLWLSSFMCWRPIEATWIKMMQHHDTMHDATWRHHTSPTRTPFTTRMTTPEISRYVEMSHL